MRLLRQLLGRTPSSPNGRVRNYVANPHLGAEHAVVHENIISPGVKVPPHVHAVEEVIIVLEGHGECHTSAGIEPIEPGTSSPLGENEGQDPSWQAAVAEVGLVRGP